tara:strand:- start:703 stop:1188 length:486 start_codon:yes stop_codon:yes gene_type:complete
MSTRSNIVLLRENGSCSAVYCHYDGYLEHNGKMLLDNYSSTEDVRVLVAMGNIRSLKPTLDEMVKEEYAEEPCNYNNLRHYMSEVDTLFIEFIYLWSEEDESWWVSRSVSKEVGGAYLNTLFYHTDFKRLVVDKEGNVKEDYHNFIIGPGRLKDGSRSTYS